MCLSTVEERFAQPSGLILGGWKNLGSDFKRPEFQTYHLMGTTKAAFDRWITASTSTLIKADDETQYQSGFHIVEDETQAKKNGMKWRVFYRYVTVRGFERGLRVVIAREMYIPSDPNGWPPKSTSTPPSGASTDQQVSAAKGKVSAAMDRISKLGKSITGTGGHA